MHIKRSDTHGRITVGKKNGVDPGIEYNVECDESGTITLTPTAVRRGYTPSDESAFYGRWSHLLPEDVTLEQAFGAAANEVSEAISENESAKSQGDAGVQAKNEEDIRQLVWGGRL